MYKHLLANTSYIYYKLAKFKIMYVRILDISNDLFFYIIFFVTDFGQ